MKGQDKSNFTLRFFHLTLSYIISNFIVKLEQNYPIFANLVDDDRMAGIVKKMMLDEVFKLFRGGR